MGVPRVLVVGLGLPLLLLDIARAQPHRPLAYVSKQCDENAIELLLDPTPLQRFVGPDFSLALDSGKARVLLAVQDCSQEWVNGENLGPAQELHVWVAIHGLEDVRPVVGAELTRPTRTWFRLFTGCNNLRIRDEKRASGVLVLPLDSLWLSPPGSESHGWVTLGKHTRYSWVVPLPVTPPARLVGVNFDVYEKDSSGGIILKRIQVLMHLTSGPSKGTLTVTGETGPPSPIPPGTYPIMVRTLFPIWARSTLGLTKEQGTEAR